ncbi:DUF2306 domain-containing protein [Crocinitomix catalasitica]|uniref:DUF2306 domain-containing protein n=1 Tax=Crocinitomix catalasitica TaxID=184607 RepID=UPI00047FF9EB|nr:DUF2306 domain-containing protein [Crocinitomix catalasitica]
MILITLQYIPVDFKAAFLRIKQDEIALVHYQWSFFIHVYISIFVLLLGITQFSKSIRLKYRSWHKAMGKAYVGLILFLAAPSGLVMAFYANGGFFSKLAFVLLAVFWFYFTFKAFQKVKQKDWIGHQKFMLRSYALTLSAISLRLFKWGLVAVFEWPPMDNYRIVAWAGWLVNLIIVEIYIYFNLRRAI